MVRLLSVNVGLPRDIVWKGRTPASDGHSRTQLVQLVGPQEPEKRNYTGRVRRTPRATDKHTAFVLYATRV